MTVQDRKKLNRLEQILPEGLLVDAKWLETRGYYRSLRSQYVSAGWLEQPTRGVFRRRRGQIGWEQVVISLQMLLRFPVSVGGQTALDLQGYAHYLRLSHQTVHLYSDKKLPGWISKLPLRDTLVFHNRLRFLPKIEPPTEMAVAEPSTTYENTLLPGAMQLTHWGQWNWPLIMSTPERAILELIDELPHRETFHGVDVIMEGLTGLRPRLLQELLENTRSIKVKRLFFFFADRHGHRWLNYIDRAKIDLGEGKRMLVKGGVLDKKYLITVPEDIDGF